ncbi:MAG: F0F1 ATP synthase subunit A [Bdellovibrionota bacterium]
MHDHFTFIGTIIDDPIRQKFVSAVLLALFLFLMAALAYGRVSSVSKRERYIVPKKFSLVGFFDFFVETFVHYQDTILGVENRKYAPFCGSVFLFLLSANLLGLIPGMAAITTTVAVNIGVALVVFCYFNYLGVKVNGLIGYLKHFGGPILALAPLIFVIEAISTCLRVLTLNLRLYWNISADHIIMSVFMEIYPLLGVAAYFLGAFVAFVQAFVFTTLTMIYIQLAVQHSEEE